MKPEQLELFPGTKQDRRVVEVHPKIGAPAALAPCDLVPFPSDRLYAYVRLIARAMDGREERLAQKYLRTERSRLIARLQAQGFTLAVAAAEAERFAIAVERNRTQRPERRRSPGGAA